MSEREVGSNLKAKQSELTAKESEMRYRSIIEEAPVATCLFVGPEMRVEVINEMMVQAWGKDFSVLQKPLIEALPELAGQSFMDLLANVYQSGIAYKGDAAPVALIIDGLLQTHYYDFTYKPMVNEEGKVWGIINVAINVTDREVARNQIEAVVAERTKQLELANQSLQDLNKELQRSNHHLEEFANAASHDLKEPVRKIRFFTEQLKGQLAPSLKEAEFRSFNRIENATDRMGTLIDDLLLYSHVSQRPHEKELVDLTDRIKRVLEDLELDIQQKEAQISLEDLPLVYGYSRQLQQLFQNLISNALKYSRSEVPPIISIRGSKLIQQGITYDSIEITDNGIGFDEKYVDKIFQMFTRLHGKHEYSGTGVGLSIVKRIIENHNGEIHVQSKEGLGSTFEVLLPTIATSA